jgi:hypothetical protein
MNYKSQVFSFTPPRDNGFGRQQKTVATCPYTFGDGCLYEENVPRDWICNDGDCWQKGLDVKEYLDEHSGGSNAVNFPEKLLQEAYHYAELTSSLRKKSAGFSW